IFLLCVLPSLVRSAHYKGGTVTWKPTNPLSNATLVEIQITLRHSWTLLYFICDRNLINTQGEYRDYRNYNHPTLICQPTPTATACTDSKFTTINHITLCTDYSNQVQSSTGAYSEKQNLSRLTNIDIAWTG